MVREGEKMMETKIKEIFERADIRQIRDFLVGGAIVANDDYGTYKDRLDRNSEDVINSLRLYLKDEEQYNETTNDLYLALYTYRDVYSEIGMKVGARILFQLLFQNDNN